MINLFPLTRQFAVCRSDIACFPKNAPGRSTNQRSGFCTSVYAQVRSRAVFLSIGIALYMQNDDECSIPGQVLLKAIESKGITIDTYVVLIATMLHQVTTAPSGAPCQRNNFQRFFFKRVRHHRKSKTFLRRKRHQERQCYSKTVRRCFQNQLSLSS